jgi:hypothetical protein
MVGWRVVFRIRLQTEDYHWQYCSCDEYGERFHVRASVESAAGGVVSGLLGLTAGRWIKLLFENKFAVDRPFLARSGLITLSSVVNSAVGFTERLRFGTRIAATFVPPPLFILGHWRSGTTHLHNLLSRDARFVSPTLVQVMFPNTFLTLGHPIKKVLGPFLPKNRLVDDMKLSVDEPQEDEFALSILSGKSPYLAYTFPRQWDYYDRYLTLRNLTGAEQDIWLETLDRFVKKLVLHNNKVPLLKSPPHTARIRYILQKYPDAQFVHISRNPYEIFQSTRNMLAIGPPTNQLQRFSFEKVDEVILWRYRAMYDAYLEDRDDVPAGQFCEIRYEALTADPLKEVGSIYEQLGLLGFDRVRPHLIKYLETIGSYSTNSYTPLTESEKRKVARAWAPFFKEFDY